LVRSNQIIDRFKKFFSLPHCYLEIIQNTECNKSRFNVIRDLLELFFSYKTFPSHYGHCRLWEVDKAQWKYYYGSNYQTYQLSRLLATVQPPQYIILFDDKAVCELLCKGIGVHNLPHTYGLIRRDQNYQEKIKSWFLESSKGPLIIKPLNGGGGNGIVLVKELNGSIVIQSRSGITPLQDFHLSDVLDVASRKTNTAIVQEMIRQDERMAVFSSSSVNTFRVVTMYTKDGSVIILAASMLCGVGESYVSNLVQGGVVVGVDSGTGRLKKYAYNYEGTRYTEHPTSHIRFEGFVIPQWQAVIDLAEKIQKALPCYRILGIDIALGENGDPVLIEVNDNPDLREQANGPLLKVEQNLRAFGEYDLFVNRHQRELYQRFVSDKCMK
jgi:hypothetical protein